MPVISTPEQYLVDDLFIDLESISGRRLYIKYEGLNLAGSIKLKAAAEMVAAVERSGRLNVDSILIESTSGNMGVALSMIAASKGLRFVCVTDVCSNPLARDLMRAYGARVHVIEHPDRDTGFLGSRLAYVRAECAADERYIWLDQYTSSANWGAHYRTTGPAIARNFPDLDVLFVGVGTAGTLMGCARYLRGLPQPPRIVAVDSVGSVVFGTPAAPRRIPGLGSSIPSKHLDMAYVDSVVMVHEIDTVRTCRQLARRGFFFGGSTGTVVSGALAWLEEHDPGRQLTPVAIAPDLGERYLGSVYDDAWVLQTYGVDPGIPAPAPAAAASPAVLDDARPRCSVPEVSRR